jgi:hypothetical protein
MRKKANNLLSSTHDKQPSDILRAAVSFGLRLTANGLLQDTGKTHLPLAVGRQPLASYFDKSPILI